MKLPACMPRPNPFLSNKVTSGLTRGAKDTERTSMLLGFRRILREALNDSDPAKGAIAEVLYGPFAAALENLEGVYWS